jgi:hypothetical protein
MIDILWLGDVTIWPEDLKKLFKIKIKKEVGCRIFSIYLSLEVVSGHVSQLWDIIYLNEKGNLELNSETYNTVLEFWEKSGIKQS